MVEAPKRYKEIKHPLNGPKSRRYSQPPILVVFLGPDAPGWCLLSSKSTRIKQSQTARRQNIKGPPPFSMDKNISVVICACRNLWLAILCSWSAQIVMNRFMRAVIMWVT